MTSLLTAPLAAPLAAPLVAPLVASFSAPVVAVYAALLSLLFCGLSARVLLLRKKLRATLGDAQDPRLARAVRVHGHFAEYVPLALLLMLLLELGGTSAVVLHSYGTLLLLSRLMHAWGVSALEENLRWRTAAMIITMSLLSGAALLLLVG